MPSSTARKGRSYLLPLVSRDSVGLAVLLFPAFRPAAIYGYEPLSFMRTPITALLFLSCLVSVILFILKDNRIDGFLACFGLFLVFVGASTVLNGGDVDKYLNQWLVLLFPCLVLKAIGRDEPDVVISGLFLLLSAVNVGNAVSLLLYPDGMYFSAEGGRMWLLGSKNGYAQRCFLWVFLAIAVDCRSRGKVGFATTVTGVVSMLTLFYAGSGSGSVAIVVLVSLLVLRHVAPVRRIIVPFTATAASVTWFFGVVVMQLIRYLPYEEISRLLGKEVGSSGETFTGRTLIWEHVLQRIAEAPVFGNGVETYVAVDVYRRGVQFDSAHNTWLQVANAGGAVALSFFLGAYAIACAGIGRLRTDLLKWGAIVTLVAFLINSMFENLVSMSFVSFLALVTLPLDSVTASRQE